MDPREDSSVATWAQPRVPGAQLFTVVAARLIDIDRTLFFPLFSSLHRDLSWLSNACDRLFGSAREVFIQYAYVHGFSYYQGFTVGNSWHPRRISC